MSNKIGFWSVLALVVGSQIGSGVFMLPATLAPFGIYSVAGWITSSLGAISLALVVPLGATMNTTLAETADASNTALDKPSSDIKSPRYSST